MKYPVFTPHITDQDIEFVTNSLREGWISSSGPYIKEFEQAFSQYLGSNFATTVSNGTAALEVALGALGITSGEVILPSFTIASCAYAIQRVGATPIFVDVDPLYFCLDPTLVERHINENTSAIMIVNMYGNTCQVDDFLSLREKYSLPIIEDCSENLGGSYQGIKSGTQFDISTFSLYANKTITSGEGGLVSTNQKELYESALRYKNLDFPSTRQFVHDKQAFNYRLASPLAALAFSQLKRIDSILYEKNRVFSLYLSLLKTDFLTPLHPRPGSVFVPWMNCFLVQSSISFSYDQFESYMRNSGIQVRPFFSNLSRQNAFSSHLSCDSKFPVTDFISHRGFYLPSAPTLTDIDIQFIASTVISYFEQ